MQLSFFISCCVTRCRFPPVHHNVKYSEIYCSTVCENIFTHCPKFSRLGIQCPAPVYVHVCCVLYVVCVLFGLLRLVFLGFFLFFSIASGVVTCFLCVMGHQPLFLNQLDHHLCLHRLTAWPPSSLGLTLKYSLIINITLSLSGFEGVECCCGWWKCAVSVWRGDGDGDGC